MNNKTIRWITNLLLCIGTGFLVTGATTLILGTALDADTVRAGATMCSISFFVVVASYVVAMLEEEL
ncbi:hypothetical protein [Pseudomonas fluorescens]|uniref:Uncharacterized protein n=1 Tax=Pseudomonas fluorescens TaxID=294 RepID=A0A5E6RF28_PSEFL|nr:hypothetical protein [Pseudomonas fluorescens]VVM66352.1 hypothetical protein PS652_01545 [Pseudomonas fluorescens]